MPTVLSILAISYERDLIYVPLLTLHLILIIVLLSLYIGSSNNDISYMFTSLLGNLISFPSLAYSYNFLPFTLIAEYIGTSWIYLPLILSKAFIISFLSICTFSSLIILPSISSVSVKIPSVMVAIYSLSSLVNNFTNFVALPTHTIKTPEAMGSKVPVCPTFLVFNFLLIIFTISLLVYPSFLFTNTIPSI